MQFNHYFLRRRLAKSYRLQALDLEIQATEDFENETKLREEGIKNDERIETIKQEIAELEKSTKYEDRQTRKAKEEEVIMMEKIAKSIPAALKNFHEAGIQKKNRAEAARDRARHMLQSKV